MPLNAYDLSAGVFVRSLVNLKGQLAKAEAHAALIAFAIPHFFYHVTTAYGILRSEGVPLTMGDFPGNWGPA